MDHDIHEEVQIPNSMEEERGGNEDCEVISQGTSLKRKASKKRSWEWDHFTKYVDDNRERAKCKYCVRNYVADSTKNGTSSMINHFNVCKNNSHNKKNKEQATNLDRYSSNTGVGGIERGLGSFSNWKFNQNDCRKAVAKMLVMEEMPFAFVESEGFRRFTSVVVPQFVVPSRSTVNRDVMDMYIEEKNKLKSLFKKTKQRMSVTTDTWTSNKELGFMSLTGHFVDSDWKLRKMILNFVPCGSHRGEDIGIAIEKCLQEWGLDDIFSITVDNASSNDNAISYLKRRFTAWKKVFLDGQYLHVRCVAHIVNLIVKEGLKEVSAHVNRIRAIVRYIVSSPTRFNRYKAMVEEENVPTRKLLSLDVPTRWNSVFFMLETAVMHKNVIDRFCMSDVEFRKDFGVDGHYSKVGEPTQYDWDIAERLVNVLRCFYELTLKVSGSHYVTSNVFLDEIANVDDAIKTWMSSDDNELVSIARGMKEKFDKYWGDPLKMNMLLFVVLILDPRRKLKYVLLTIKDIYGSEIGESIGEIVKTTLNRLFEEYRKLYGSSKSHGASGSHNDGRVRPNVSKAFLNRWNRCYGEDSMLLGESELESYLSEKPVKENLDMEFDILKWWKGKSEEPYPVLSRMARDLLAMPISTVASESAFSTGGRVIDDFRSSLSPKTIEALICLQDWLRTRPHTPIEEDHESVEKIEKEVLSQFRSMNMEWNSSAQCQLSEE